MDSAFLEIPTLSFRILVIPNNHIIYRVYGRERGQLQIMESSLSLIWDAEMVYWSTYCHLKGSVDTPTPLS